MNSLFFLLSGEHETLPAAEVLAILESEGYKYMDVRSSPKLLTLTTDRSCIEIVVERAGMCNLGGLILFQTENCENEIFRKASEVLYLDYLGSGERFVVRTLRLFDSSRHLERKRIESIIGSLISSAVPKSIVDPVRYNKEFLGIIGEKFLFGIVVSRSHRPGLVKDALKSRPALHPATIQPKLAKSLVNLARARPGDIFMDPFCGVGGILIEAAAMGCRVVGSDISPDMVKKTLLNFRYLKLEPYGLLVADAKKLPYPRAFSLATDPPYGRASSTYGLERSTLIREFLREIKNIIMPDRFLCIASPSTIDICRLGYEEGLTIVERHVMRVHKSLTREIVVFSIKKRDSA
ncbi:MAG: TRM11 family methyltransferase [Candidatus Bathyarchaeia archaeon]